MKMPLTGLTFRALATVWSLYGIEAGNPLSHHGHIRCMVLEAGSPLSNHGHIWCTYVDQPEKSAQLSSCLLALRKLLEVTLLS
jgi:hypothetical protein